MSGLELAASLAGLVSLGMELCKGITQYCMSYQGAQKDIELLHEDTNALIQTFESLQTAMQDSTLKLELEKSVTHIFSACRERVANLSKELEKYIEPTKAQSKRGSISIKARIFYPFQEKGVQKLRDDISRINEILQQATGSVLIRQNNKINDIIDRIHDSGELDKIKDWLLPPDFSTSQMIASDKRSENTGSWFLESEEFVRWQDSPCSLLWVSGGAGRGKTVLCSTAINYLIADSEHQRSSAVAYIYFDQTNQSVSQDHNRLLRSLVQQLAAQNTTGSVPAPLKSLYSRSQNGTRPPMTHDLTNTLRYLIETFSPCYLVADAFDECKEKQAFLKLVNTIIGQWKIPQVRFLVTSRSELSSELPNRSWKGFTLSLEESNNGDVRNYIETTLESPGEPLNAWDPERRKSIAKSLIARGNGNDLFSIATIKVGDEEYSELRLAHLSVRDYLLSTKILTSPASYFYITELSAHHSIAQACIVYLQQFGTGDQLPTYEEAIFETPLTLYAARFWFHHVQASIKAASQQSSVATAYPTGIDAQQATLIILIIQFLTQLLGLLGVEAPVLMKSSGVKNQLLDLNQLCVDFLVSQGQTQIRFFDPDTPWVEKPRTSTTPGHAGPSPLYTAAQAGFLDVVRQLVRQGMDINSVGGRFGTPLQAAACKGYTDILLFLLKEGADPNLRGGDYGCALQGASRYGQEACVKILLKAGVDVNATCGEYYTAAHAAAFHGHAHVLKLLADNGADIQILRPRDRAEPLILAASVGHLAVVELLLSLGADVLTRDKDECTALDHAAPAGFDEVVKLVIAHDRACLKTSDRLGNTALHYTVAQNFPSVVELLLQNGMDPNFGNHQGRTALHSAIRTGNIEVIETLLRYGAAVNKKDAEGWTPLHLAAYFDKLEVGQMLLDTDGSIIDIPGPNEYTPLHIAVLRTNVEFIKFLGNRGAEFTHCLRVFDTNDGVVILRNFHVNYISPITGLRIAASYGLEVQLRDLLEGEADINGTDEGGRSALYYASRMGNNSIVRLLIENGADVKEKTDDNESFMDFWLDQDIIDLAYKHGYGDRPEVLSDMGDTAKQKPKEEMFEYLGGKLPADELAPYRFPYPQVDSPVYTLY
ncbi:hypothetical protein TWF106_007634 [Orbilia oligospora]|uniref:NACHT domain-containing protein n=1 Tax=Orbilia oligospora TaxID=2813651 RepID=A0A7C8QLH2_ORBOL|nr:hypothetical protein TWF106_007634 [Orbilia oligospora]